MRGPCARGDVPAGADRDAAAGRGRCLRVQGTRLAWRVVTVDVKIVIVASTTMGRRAFPAACISGGPAARANCKLSVAAARRLASLAAAVALSRSPRCRYLGHAAR